MYRVMPQDEDENRMARCDEGGDYVELAAVRLYFSILEPLALPVLLNLSLATSKVSFFAKLFFPSPSGQACHSHAAEPSSRRLGAPGFGVLGVNV